MAKKRIDVGTYLYPMPLVIIGSHDLQGKPNFMCATYVGAVDHEPPTICVALTKNHHSNPGIEVHAAFSVNTPSVSLRAAVDYAGTKTGREVDKSRLFKSFYGDLSSAPMVQACPVCLECELVDVIEFQNNRAYIGRIAGAYVEEDVLDEGLPNMAKVDPLIFSMHNFEYYRLGERLGPAFVQAEGYVPDPDGI
ncbi:MAG: flavin reductase family protein [Actinobacteria bacterium HGW-Actinobacteria-7]|jgi:flavin reductase (DIM6/NTAB) family NADH-FMN oxidoreductase RutF|nr:MAG: flavin reductase family protein [Actinobacteria bacterium HGW-Actinobacteria-7]